ncbi:MAG: protein kinase [Minicystis sp.]
MHPGFVVDGRFEIERLAGAGGMGEIYRARDLRTGDPVAVKVQLGAATARDVARFEREATALAGLAHPGIVRYVAHGAEGGQRWLAMEWLDGEDLGARLLRGPLTVPDALALGARLAEALGAAHAHGIVHRDLKPSNVVLPGGSIADAKLIDFGIARLRWTERATQTGTVMGTPGYMAPEHVQGTKEIDARADVFTLGAILYECLTGAPAFQARDVMALLVKIMVEDPPPLREHCPHAPPALAIAIGRMLAKDPALRPADGAAAAVVLRAIEAEEPGGSAEVITGRAALTRAEQRVLCVVLVGAEAVAAHMAPTAAHMAPTVSLDSAPDIAATVSLDSAKEAGAILSFGGASSYAALRDTMSRRGAQLRVLADGAIAVTIAGGGVATDQAAQAAGCALALRSMLPDRPVALATGRGGSGEVRAGGEAIERAARLIRARATALAAGPPRTPLPIDLDEVTAGLLDQRFVVEVTESGHELHGERGGEGTMRTLLGKPTTFAGREREMATLDATYDECEVEAVARAALVTGPAGVGKSRLRYELIRRIEARGRPVTVLAARGDPMRAGAPFGLVAQLVRRAAQLFEGEPVEERRRKLSARVARGVPAADRDRVAAFLGELVGAPFPDEDRVQLRAARLDPMLMGDQMRRAFVDFVAGASSEAPLVLVIEDLHWGDQPSVEYLDAALRVLADRPLLVLALARPEVHDLFPRLWAERSALEIRLGELSRRACERIVKSVLGDALSPEALARLWERSAGNAFFLEELVRATAEGKKGELPETVLAMVQSRLESLDAEDRRILRAGSVFGAVFWRGGLALLLGAARPAALDDRLASLERREWLSRRPEAIFQGEREYAFRHALHREAAYGMLTDEDRALGHRLAGAWLAEVGETDAMALAGHFERGGEEARAVRFYLRAAEQALEGNDLAAVLARVDRALRCGAAGPDLGELSLIRAEAHHWRGEHAEGGRWAEQAQAAFEPGSARWFTATSHAFWGAAVGGDAARALDLGEALRATSPAEGAETARVSALSEAANWLLMMGRNDASAALAAAMTDVPGSPSALAMVHATRAIGAAYRERDLGLARDEITRAVACFDEAGDRRRACLWRSNAAFMCVELGAYAEAVTLARAALADAQAMGNASTVVQTRTNLGWALAKLGQLDEAVALVSAAVAQSVAHDDRRSEGTARTYLAVILKQRGDLAAAEAEARRAVEVLVVARPLLPAALATLAAVLLAGGRAAEAIAPAREAHALLEEIGPIEEGEPRVWLTYVEALEAIGEQDAARAAVASARDRILDQASKLRDPAVRESFLANVPEAARILDLAARRLG